MSLPGIHHVAFACRDLMETHLFYTEVMGFVLEHTELSKLGEGHFRHAFFKLENGSSIAFFELHGVGEPSPLKTAISTDMGLPAWVNHVAFQTDAERTKAILGRLREKGGRAVAKHSHGWCHSTYLMDPNGILLELCEDTPGMPDDRAEAFRLLTAEP